MSELLTPSEITRYLHVSLGSVMKAVHSGELPATEDESGCRKIELENAIEFARAHSLDAKALLRLRKQRVLVVDDDNDFKEMLLDVLTSEQRIWAKAAGSLFEARRVLSEFRPHYLILDAQLPDGNGWELMDDIAELNRLDRPKVVGISALSSGTIAKNMQDSGISEFITKPVDPHKLLESVKRSVMDSNTPD